VQEIGRRTAITKALHNRNAAGPRGLKLAAAFQGFLPDRASFRSSVVPAMNARAPLFVGKESEDDDAFLR